MHVSFKSDYLNKMAAIFPYYEGQRIRDFQYVFLITETVFLLVMFKITRRIFT
jgi:hypothetical protein